MIHEQISSAFRSPSALHAGWFSFHQIGRSPETGWGNEKRKSFGILLSDFLGLFFFFLFWVGLLAKISPAALRSIRVCFFFPPFLFVPASPAVRDWFRSSIDGLVWSSKGSSASARALAAARAQDLHFVLISIGIWRLILNRSINRIYQKTFKTPSLSQPLSFCATLTNSHPSLPSRPVPTVSQSLPLATIHPQPRLPQHTTPPRS